MNVPSPPDSDPFTWDKCQGGRYACEADVVVDVLWEALPLRGVSDHAKDPVGR